MLRRIERPGARDQPQRRTTRRRKDGGSGERCLVDRGDRRDDEVGQGSIRTGHRDEVAGVKPDERIEDGGTRHPLPHSETAAKMASRSERG